MENMINILFLCVVIPMLPALTLLQDKRSRLFLGFMLTGMGVCLIAAEINALLLPVFSDDYNYVTTNITPITEELLKALPVIYFAWVISDDRERILSVAFAVGLGFATLENLVILTKNIEAVTIWWAFARGAGAALMHSICTAAVGFGISYIRRRRKLFYCGTFSLLIAAIIYHAVFNSLVQSEYRVFSFIMTLALCYPLLKITKSKRASLPSQD